jgi:type IV secretory pathway TrbL component
MNELANASEDTSGRMDEVSDDPMNDEVASEPSAKSLGQWLALNLVLIGLYLGFFHLSLLVEFPGSLLIGLVIAGVMAWLCFQFRKLFLGRYENFIYYALPLDIALEGLIPFHSGYSFYWCAASFWLVFGCYRAYRLVNG